MKNKRVTLVDEVENCILEYIEKNNYKKGDRLPSESQLIESLGVGRSVLREALSRLRMLGLIETRTKTGMVVSEPNIMVSLKKVINSKLYGEKTLIDLLEFRIALEIGISDLIIENVTNQDIEELKEIVNNGRDNAYYLPEEEYRFHTKLYRIAGNEVIEDFQEIVLPIFDFIYKKFNNEILPIKLELQKKNRYIDHSALLECIQQKDKVKFRKAVIDSFAAYGIFIKKYKEGKF